MKRLFQIGLLVVCAAGVFSCANIEVNPAVACTNGVTEFCIKDIKVGDESVDDEGSTVEVSTAADVVVKWKYVESGGVTTSDSETISAFNIKDGAVWTVYASYVDY